MTEDVYRKWDVFLKIFVPLLTVVGILIGIWQFNTLQANNDLLEFKRRAWEKQLDVYVKTTNIASELSVNAKNAVKLRENINAFNSLHWGNMILVDDDNVRKAMIKFQVEIKDFNEGRSNQDNLKIRANELAVKLPPF